MGATHLQDFLIFACIWRDSALFRCALVSLGTLKVIRFASGLRGRCDLSSLGALSVLKFGRELRVLWHHNLHRIPVLLIKRIVLGKLRELKLGSGLLKSDTLGACHLFAQQIVLLEKSHSDLSLRELLRKRRIRLWSISTYRKRCFGPLQIQIEEALRKRGD